MQQFRRVSRLALCAGLSLASLRPAIAADGFMLYQNDAQYLKFGGRVQVQYHQNDLDPGTDTEDVFFRRVTPYLEAGLGKDWLAKAQVELVSASTGRRKTAYKDDYLQYKGIKDVQINIGNAGFPYSREFLTSAERQQFVERTVTGNRNYGVPYRDLGLHLLGQCADTRISYGLSVASATLHQDATKILFDSPLDRVDPYQSGWIAGGRIDYHPFGKLAFSQGDFDGKTRATIGVAAYTWNNSGHTLYTNAAGTSTSTTKNDVEQIRAVELSGAVRYLGLSADAEYNRIGADAVDRNFTGKGSGNLYKNGQAALRSYMVKGGYMLLANRLELVTGYQGLDADTYTNTWTTAFIGANWFFNRHDLKLQTAYQRGKDVKGTPGKNQDELFAQLQAVF